MIIANGMEYKTLKQSLYANGKKVVEAYCNGNLVYPDREDTQLIKVVGSINTAVSHDHAGENPSCTSLDDCHYTYHGGDTYRAKGCFCLVMRNHSYNGSLQKSTLAFQQATKTIPAAKWPLSGAYSASKSNGDLYGPGNAWVVYTYQGGSCPMLPTAGEGIHPLLGSDAIETHALNKSGNLIRAYYSAELLLYTDEGISGTSRKKREGFNRMIKDALDGKIDVIITKSISRFARNTVDTLTTVRELKDHGVEVIFEKENIHTFDSNGETFRADLIQTHNCGDRHKSPCNQALFGVA